MYKNFRLFRCGVKKNLLSEMHHMVDSTNPDFKTRRDRGMINFHNQVMK